MSLTIPLPSLAAYRADLAAIQSAGMEERSGHWLSVAVRVEKLAADAPDARAAGLPALGALLLGEESGDLDRISPQLRETVGAAEDAGALRLAHAMVARWRSIDELSPLERGRCLAVEGRVLRQLDAREQAAERYMEVERIGRRHALPELRARAAIGQVVLAQLRGNYPEMRVALTSALAHATAADEWTLIAQCHQGLMMTAAAAHDHDAAVSHAWQSFRLAEHDDTSAAEALVNLGQLLVDLGRYEAALSAFAAAIVRTPPLRLELPATAGAAVAAATVGDAALVRALAARIERIDRSTEGFPYVRAMALLEAAEACRAVRDDEAAARLRARAMELATARGYHEVSLRAESLATAPARVERAPVPLERASVDIVDRVEALADSRALLAAV